MPTGYEDSSVLRFVDVGKSSGVLGEVDLVFEKFDAFLVLSEGLDGSRIDLGLSTLGRGEINGVTRFSKYVERVYELGDIYAAMNTSGGGGGGVF